MKPRNVKTPDVTLHAAKSTVEWIVTGRTFSVGRPGLGGLSIELVDKKAGPDKHPTSGVTDDRGNYSLEIPPAALRRLGNDSSDLQASVSAGKTFLGASEVRYNASASEVIDVVLPESASAALPSEHESLKSAIAARYEGKAQRVESVLHRVGYHIPDEQKGWGPRCCESSRKWHN